MLPQVSEENNNNYNWSTKLIATFAVAFVVVVGSLAVITVRHSDQNNQIINVERQMSMKEIDAIISRGPQYHSLMPIETSSIPPIYPVKPVQRNSSNAVVIASPKGQNKFATPVTVITTCDAYVASNTASATKNTVSCSFTVPAGVTFMVADCQSTGCMAGTNDQYIRLYDGAALVASNDDFCSRCSKISFTNSGLTPKTYTLQQGCYGTFSCSGQFVVSVLTTLTCSPYIASNTNNAMTNTVTCSFNVCPGAGLQISGCSSGTGEFCQSNDQYIRLFDGSNTLLASNDDSCSRCSAMSLVIGGGPCQTLTLKQGCYGTSSCAGTFQVSGVAGSATTSSSSPSTTLTFPPSSSSVPSKPPTSKSSITTTTLPTRTPSTSSIPTIKPITKSTTITITATPTFTVTNKPSLAPVITSSSPTTKPSNSPSTTAPSSTKPSINPSTTVPSTSRPSSAIPTTATPVLTSSPSSGTPNASPISASPVTATPISGTLPTAGSVSFTYATNTPVMTGTVNLYNIYYGDFSSASGQQFKSLVDFFAANIGGSSWHNIMTQYYQIISGVKTFMTNSVSLKASVSTYTTTQGGTMTESQVTSIISNLISTGQLPQDPNGIYAFIFRGDVQYSGWIGSSVKQWCGYHTAYNYNGQLLKFFVVGDQSSSGGNSGCAAMTTNTPNGNYGADAIASVYAHEVVETTSDYAGAWYSRSGTTAGQENADICGWSFGSYLPGTNNANTVIGGKKWLIQRNWVPNVGCRQQWP